MGWFARYLERNALRIDTMHRDPRPDRGGCFAEKDVSVIASCPDGGAIRVDFRLPISRGKALYFANDIASGKAHEGAAVTVTRLASD